MLTTSGVVFWTTASSPEESVFHGHADDYREILPFFLLPHFILHEEGFLRRHYCQKRTKCQRQDFRPINCIERSSRGSPWSPEAISHLLLTLSSSPEVPVRSSTVASCRLSCLLHLLTLPQCCCSPQLPPSWCPTLQVSTNRVTWGILFLSLRTTI